MASTSKLWIGAAAMLALPLSFLILLRFFASIDARFFSPNAHLVFVGGIALCASMIAVAAAVNSRKATHPGGALLSIGAASVGLLMLGHGLTTPGVLSQPPNPWVGRFPHLALSFFALTLFLAGQRVDNRWGRWVTRHSTALVVSSVGAVAAFTAYATVESSLWAPPSWEENALDALSFAVVGLSLLVVLRHWRRWQLGRDVVQLALTFAAAMTIAAVTSLQHGKFQQLSWWDYHAYLLAGFGCAVYAIVFRSRRSRRVTETLSTAFSDDPFAHISDGYPIALLQLVKAVEIKDAYTHGHSKRTARVATELGMRMGLSPDRLRVIARGAYLHDIGKIGVPDQILNKPDRLTDDERAVIETHPALGHEMAKTAPSLHEALGVILHHHERVDGGGYPDGLVGSEIPLEARVVAVADVWDALTTDRSYRPGWPPAEALAHIHAGSGTHFDAGAVRALVDLAAEWGIRMSASEGSGDEAWEAGQTCHQTPDDAQLVGV
jgi:HD-GYP domain-containing protein (c-di-GMP phosphodiesterase class II)